MSPVTLVDPPDAPLRTLIDDLLAEQQSLSAVERFARRQKRGRPAAQARYYRELIPLSRPERGEQYAFAVDLDACTGCKACVNACHSLNGLDEDEIWRNVGVLIGGTTDRPYQQAVTTACHHCGEPACLLGCPVMAYEKDASTGIVRHLDDQCIGCQYCILKCPYDVPKYSKARGIVRKCDLCYHRLSADEAPACVQACPSAAIAIRIVSAAEIRIETAPGSRLIPGAFDSSYTRPTTVYATEKSIPRNTRAGDCEQLRLEPPHWPLIWLLLLTQLSAGVFVFLALERFLFATTVARMFGPLAWTGLTAVLAGLIASIFHLGHPLKAWRFFLGLRTSWMSREILVLGMFAASAAFCALEGSAGFRVRGAEISSVLLALTALLGVAGVFCSAMIYIDTRRPFWGARFTLPKFVGATLLLGAAASTMVLSWLDAAGPAAISFVRSTLLVAVISGMVCATWEACSFHRSLHDSSAATHRATRTLWKLLRRLLWLRASLLAGAIISGTAAALAMHWMQTLAATMFFLLTFGAALVERYCFFTASDAPRMPGAMS